MFDAMKNQNIKTSNELLIQTGHYHSYNPYRKRVIIGKFQDYIEQLVNSDRIMSERLLEPTSITVIGNVASIISRYEFYVNEQLSHQGDEVFTFLKRDGKRIITGSTYTVERNN